MANKIDATRFYTFKSSQGVNITMYRGTDPPTITGGGARYTTVQRPKRMSMIQWDGDDPYTMDVPVMFDGWMQQKSVERDIQWVNEMMHSPGAWVAPVTLRIDGALPVKGGTWIMTGIDYGNATIWATDVHGKGFRYRQDAVIHLLQYVPETVLSFLRKPGTTTPYIVKHGDTMAAIAKKWYVTPAAIMKKNNIRDPKKILPNQLILIPPALFGPMPGVTPSTGTPK